MDNVFSEKTRGVYLSQDPAISQAIFPANEDWTVMVEVVEAGAGIVVGKKIWDLFATPRYLYAVQVGTGYPAIGSVVLFHRCGDFANQGANGFELHAGDPTKSSWSYLASSPVLEIYDNGNGTGYPVNFTAANAWSVNGETLPIFGSSVGSGRLFPGQRLGSEYYIFRGSVANKEKTWETDLLIGNDNYRFALDTDAAGKVVDMRCQATTQVFWDDPTYEVFGFNLADDYYSYGTADNAPSLVFYNAARGKYYFAAKAVTFMGNPTWHTPAATKWIWQAYSDAAGTQLYLQNESTLFGQQGTYANWVWFEAPRNRTQNKNLLNGNTDPYICPPNSSIYGDGTPYTYVRYLELNGGIWRRSPLKQCNAYVQWVPAVTWDGFYDPATDTAQPWASAPTNPIEAYAYHYWTATQYMSGNDEATDRFLWAYRSASHGIIPKFGNVDGAFYVDNVAFRANTSLSPHGIYYAHRASTNCYLHKASPAGWFTLKDLGISSLYFPFWSLSGFYVADRWKSIRVGNTASAAPPGPWPYFNSYYTLDFSL